MSRASLIRKFTLERRVSVSPPYRLDLTAEALRRLAANVVDVFDGNVYRRALSDSRGVSLIEVTQPAERSLSVRISGAEPERWVPVVHRMLATRVNLDRWYERAQAYPWLAYLSRELTGLRPPRYPSLWEALVHSIVFQQISIHAAAAIMRRVVETLAEPVEYNGDRYYPFPAPQALERASDAVLRSAGLSANKAAHLRNAADAVTSGSIDADEIERLPSAQAADKLCAVRGIGPWSAAVVLLRGFGRLDVFPMKDSGVARSIRLLSGGAEVDAEALLCALGPFRGMLYFHLLLGRMRNLTAAPSDSELP